MIAHADMSTIKDNISNSFRLFDELPAVIERSISEFDRSFNGSMPKAEVKRARRAFDGFVDGVNQLTKTAQRFVATMLNGSPEEVEALEIGKTNINSYQQHHERVKASLDLVKYYFFVASTKEKWAPHLSDLKYMERRTVSALSEFLVVSKEIQDLVPHFMTLDDEGIVELPPSLEASLQSEVILTPDWVKSGSDYVKWVRSRAKSEF